MLRARRYIETPMRVHRHLDNTPATPAPHPQGQARLDGAFCDYTKEDKFEFLEKAHKAGVCNIEMESLCFASMCHHANIKGTRVCDVTNCCVIARAKRRMFTIHALTEYTKLY